MVSVSCWSFAKASRLARAAAMIFVAASAYVATADGAGVPLGATEGGAPNELVSEIHSATWPAGARFAQAASSAAQTNKRVMGGSQREVFERRGG